MRNQVGCSPAFAFEVFTFGHTRRRAVTCQSETPVVSSVGIFRDFVLGVLVLSKPGYILAGKQGGGYMYGLTAYFPISFFFFLKLEQQPPSRL